MTIVNHASFNGMLNCMFTHVLESNFHSAMAIPRTSFLFRGLDGSSSVNALLMINSEDSFSFLQLCHKKPVYMQRRSL